MMIRRIEVAVNIDDARDLAALVEKNTVSHYRDGIHEDLCQNYAEKHSC